MVHDKPDGPGGDPALRLSVLTISKTLENCRTLIESVLDQPCADDVEILVSWNGEPGDAKALVDLCPDKVRAFDIQPYHFAKNNNDLARRARGPCLAFVNDDVVLDVGALDAALDALREPCVGVVGARLRYEDDRVQHVGVAFKSDYTPFHLSKRRFRLHWDEYQTLRVVPAVTGAFIAVRRDEFLSLGFDEAFSVAGEDIDFCLRYRAAFDREIAVAGGAGAVHVENATRRLSGDVKTPTASLNRIAAQARALKNGRPLIDPARPRIAVLAQTGSLRRRMEHLRDSLPYTDLDVVDSLDEMSDDADVHYLTDAGALANWRAQSAKPFAALLIGYDGSRPPDAGDRVAHAVSAGAVCIVEDAAARRRLLERGAPATRVQRVPFAAEDALTPRLTVGLILDRSRASAEVRETFRQWPVLQDQAHVVEIEDEQSAAYGAAIADAGIRPLPDECVQFFASADVVVCVSPTHAAAVGAARALRAGAAVVAPRGPAFAGMPVIFPKDDTVLSFQYAVQPLLNAWRLHEGPVDAEPTFAQWVAAHDLLFRRVHFSLSAERRA